MRSIPVRKTPKATVKQYEYSLDGGKTWNKTSVSALSDGRLSFIISGLDAATKYSVSVRAVTTAGAKASEGKTTFTTKGTLPTTGSNPARTWMSALLMILGGVLLLSTRRRVA